MKKLFSLIFVCAAVSAFAVDYPISEGDLNAQSTLVMSATVKTNEEVGPKLGQLFGAVAAYIASHGIKASPVPFARYHRYEPGIAIEFDAGFTTAKAEQGQGDIKASELPKTQVLHTTHFGPYEKIAPAYEALHVYMNGHQKAPNGGPWEIYANDPSTVKPEQIQTEIFYPVK